MINWIKVSERLPEDYKLVLLFSKDFFFPVVGWYNSYYQSFYVSGMHAEESITYWAELSDINLPEM